MDLLDLILLVVLALAAVHGLRVGAAIQLATFVGFLAGIALGVVLVMAIAPHVSGQLTKTVVALVVLFVPAVIFAGIGRAFGARVWRAIRRARLGAPDALLGAGIAVLSTLVACWLIASVLINSQFSLVSNQIARSGILSTMNHVMPPVPDAFASVERYLNVHGFPEVFANLVPQPAGPVRPPTAAEVAAAVAEAGGSVVKVVADGCDEEQEGSAFVVARDLVVTNAHVIAGTTRITVEDARGSYVATPIFFDPRFDLAVLETEPLGLPVLHLDPDLVGRGAPAAVLGYPGGGPFTVRRAGVLERFVAEGRDIYDQGLTERTVYELQAIVRPGNSGGPLVAPDGEVIGVVFSRSSSNPDIGYALASPGVLKRVERAEADPHLASTESCMS
jgi:S1-C subfamily serine protease